MQLRIDSLAAIHQFKNNYYSYLRKAELKQVTKLRFLGKKKFYKMGKIHKQEKGRKKQK
jgi:hypothetical protein